MEEQKNKKSIYGIISLICALLGGVLPVKALFGICVILTVIAIALAIISLQHKEKKVCAICGLVLSSINVVMIVFVMIVALY